MSGGSRTVSQGTLVLANASGNGLGSGYALVDTNGTLCGTGLAYLVSHPLPANGVLAVGNPGHSVGSSLTVSNQSISINAGVADVLNAQCPVLINTKSSSLNVLNPKGLTGWKSGYKWKFASWSFAPTNAFVTLNLPALSGGVTWDTSQIYTSGTLAIVLGAPTRTARILGVKVMGGHLVLTGTNNNVPNTSFQYAILASPDLSVPLTNWTVLSTNAFSPNDTFRALTEKM